MGFNNPDWTWRELESALSDRADSGADAGTDPWERGDPRHSGRARDGRAPGSPSWNAGGDGPAWSRKRQPFRGDGVERCDGAVPYAELHCHSNFSFLDGASHPEELATEAARLGLDALAITDHNGFYGIVRFAEAARAVGMPTVFGTEITASSQSGVKRLNNWNARSIRQAFHPSKVVDRPSASGRPAPHSGYWAACGSPSRELAAQIADCRRGAPVQWPHG